MTEILWTAMRIVRMSRHSGERKATAIARLRPLLEEMRWCLDDKGCVEPDAPERTGPQMACEAVLWMSSELAALIKKHPMG
ncbi:hypothetical protein JIG36_37455 [Actinoplanes sp. LDG1-06]|uniref:Uncharacterized protein n=1 Tax=Paractinoplanes ovalisporus TaxID=2810368 RepID=A0ABS2AN52_9ACTN|nr:hypothetical protein [Actinoplanes ovalisporus]MBM2621205.1 hypothetical protein [Actinoplanes ovalisporus]